MPDYQSPEFWRAIHDVGLAGAGALLGGGFLLIGEMMKSGNAKADRERELLKESAVKFAGLMTELKSLHIAYVKRCDDLVVALKAGKPHKQYDRELEMKVLAAIYKEATGLAMVCSIGGFGEVAVEIRKYTAKQVETLQAILAMATSASTTAEIAKDLKDNYEKKEAEINICVVNVEMTMKRAFKKIG